MNSNKIISNGKKQDTEIKRDLIVESLLSKVSYQHGLDFHIKNNELSIFGEINTDKKRPLIEVPLKQLPLLVDYRLTIKSNFKLYASIKGSPINPNAESTMRTMCALYNSTNKLEQWNNKYPLLCLKKHDSLVNSLFSFRPQGQKIQSFKAMYDCKKYDELLLQSFIGSRAFTYKKDALASAGITTQNQSELGLLAIIDFLNHKMGKSSYVINRETACMEIYGNEVDSAGEVFVQYGFLDAVQTYLIYGFVDTLAPILFSGRLQFKLKSGLNFVVLGMSGGLKRTVPLSPELEYLNSYLPPGIKREGDNIVVNELVIPSGKKASYLKDVLTVILQQCDNSAIYANRKVLNEEIEHIEQQLLALNIAFWKQYNDLVEQAVLSDKKFSKEAAQDLVTLCTTCLGFCQSFTE